MYGMNWVTYSFMRARRVSACNTHPGWSYMPQLLPYIHHCNENPIVWKKKKSAVRKSSVQPCDQAAVVAHGGSWVGGGGVPKSIRLPPKQAASQGCCAWADALLVQR